MVMLTYITMSNAPLKASALTDYVSSQYLTAHNKIRNGQGLQPFVWNKKLALDAQNYAKRLADYCYLAASNSLVFGENILQSWGPRGLSPKEVVSRWFASRDDCVEAKSCPRYTQLISETTRLVGCGYSFCKSAGSYAVSGVYVCRYWPSRILHND